MTPRVGRFLSLALFLLLFFACVKSHHPFLHAQEEPFRAVLISDSHLGFAKSDQAFQDFLEDAPALPGKAKVLINNGDIAEVGNREIFRSYKKAIESIFPESYNVIGNHDTRWNPDGKQAYEEEISPRYYSKDFSGIHWMFLDSTLEHQTQGHVDFQEMAWIKTDLKTVPPDKPILVFSHHPFKWRGVSVDNGLEVINLFRGYNVAAFFNGHGHKLERIFFRQIPFIENDALFHGNYLILEKSEDAVHLFVKKIGDTDLLPWFKFPLHPSPSLNRILVPHFGAFVGETFPMKVKAAEGSEGASLVLDHQEPFLLAGQGIVQKEATLAEKGWHDLKLFLPGNALPEDETYLFLKGDITPIRLGEIYAGLGTDGKSVVAGTLGGTLFCVSSKKEILWERKLDGGILAAPLVVYPWVFVGTRDGTFYALSLRTGSILWTFTPGSPITASPVAWGDTVLFGAGDKNLYALDLKTGEERWRTRLGGFSEMQPRVADGVVYVGAWDHTFYALLASNGHLLWKKNIGKALYYSPSVASPEVAHGTVFVAAKDRHLYALDAKTGKQKWEKKVNDSFSSPVLQEGILILPELNGRLVALNPEDGKELWEKRFPTNFYNASPVLSENKLFLVGVDGRYFEVDLAGRQANSGIEVSRGFVFSTPVIAGGEIWIGSLDGYLYGIPLR